MTPITALTDPNQLPNQLQDQQTFDTNMAYMVDMYPERARQENALALEMMETVSTIDSLAAGGAYSFPYLFDPSDADADPGVGRVRFNSNTQNQASVLRFDTSIVGGVDISPVFAALLSVSSSVKGSIRIVKSQDPGRWILFDVTGGASPTGYRNLNVVCRVGSHASPFTSGDRLMVYIERAGDKGDKPLGGAMVCLASATVAGVSAINYLNLFTSEYDHYLIDFSEYLLTAGSAVLYMRLAIAGAVYGGATHTSNPVGNSSDPTVGGVTALALATGLSSSLYSPGVSVDLLNTSSNNSPTLVKVSGINRNSNSGFDTKDGLMMVNVNAVISGFQLFTSAGVIAAGKLRVYGYRNQVGIL
jgi:hypothetical protein